MGRKTQEPRRLRVYEQWQGNERFFCWGHCITGPSWKSGMGSLALLIAPTVVFLVFVVPYMSQNISPIFWVVSCILAVICGMTLLMTSCRDPGILPRQEPDEEWLQARKPRTKDVDVNGYRVTVRYNDTCHFYQPPRAHHCSVNDNCIERFDHHCPWVGTTVGKRNYRTFLLFIYTCTVYIAWTFGVSLGSLFVKHAELEAAAAAAPPQDSSDGMSSNLWLRTLSQSGAAIALMIFTFIFFWFVCGLSGFHTWLVATNQTTYENFRYNHNQVPNPYDEGILRNCASVLCVRIPPSKVQFRAFLDEVVREPVQLGYNDWSPAPVPTPPRSEQQMSPLGGGSTLAAASGEWPGGAAASTAQYGSTAEQQYSATNGNAMQYARAAAVPGTGRYQEVGGHGASQLPPAAAMGQQSFDSVPEATPGGPPVSRPQAYSSSSPPPLGPHYTTSSGQQGPAGMQGPLSAGLAAVQIPQGDSSAASSPYYTPQQSGTGQLGSGPLTSSLQQQQQQLHVQAQPHLQHVHAHAELQQQQYRAEPVGAAGEHQGWQQQQQQQKPSVQQGGTTQLQGLRSMSRESPVSQQQVQLEMATGSAPQHRSIP